MKPVGFAVDAVLKAADEWVAAQEALIAAKPVAEETEAEEEAVDVAGAKLVLAVTRWRSCDAAREGIGTFARVASGAVKFG